jgi:hypothetical protein
MSGIQVCHLIIHTSTIVKETPTSVMSCYPLRMKIQITENQEMPDSENFSTE